MDDKNKEKELIDASSSPLFQLANETKEEEQQINNDFIAKKQNETNITNSEVNQMFNKGTVASPNNTFNNENTFTNDNNQSTFTNEESQNTFTNPEEHKTFFNQDISENTSNDVPPVPPAQPPQNNESNPMLGIAMLIILFWCIGGVAIYNIFIKDSGSSNNTSSVLKEEEKDKKEEKEDTTKQEEQKNEEQKKEEQVQEVTSTMTCSGTRKDNGITVNSNVVIVFKNNVLYTIKVVEKSNSLNKESIDILAKTAYAGGYSYSTTPDYKSITMSGTKNTLNRSVKDKIGTLDLATSYYKALGLKCDVK